MKIELKEISVRDISAKYTNNYENGAMGYDGKLNIRPKYQREFIYKDKQRNAVIETLKKDFPLNVMYWVKNTDGTYEVLDGQQRTISICEYVVGRFSVNGMYFHNLEKEEREQILSYKLMIYFCEGEDREKLDWFEVINTAGEKLTDQELRNAIYTGTWLTEAKRHFSKTGCPAHGIASKYMKGSAIRQDYLETAIKWISKNNIEDYMSKNQHKPNANELWLYFRSVIEWVNVLFPNYRKEMKRLAFGFLYNEYKDTEFDAKSLEKRISTLMQDEDITSKSGIYQYVITENEKFLSIRTFTDKQKRTAYEKQKGICPKCKKPNNHYDLDEMEADHITPWSKGGKTTAENCQMLCKHHNRLKSDV